MPVFVVAAGAVLASKYLRESKERQDGILSSSSSPPPSSSSTSSWEQAPYSSPHTTAHDTIRGGSSSVLSLSTSGPGAMNHSVTSQQRNRAHLPPPPPPPRGMLSSTIQLKNKAKEGKSVRTKGSNAYAYAPAVSAEKEKVQDETKEEYEETARRLSESEDMCERERPLETPPLTPLQNSSTCATAAASTSTFSSSSSRTTTTTTTTMMTTTFHPSSLGPREGTSPCLPTVCIGSSRSYEGTTATTTTTTTTTTKADDRIRPPALVAMTLPPDDFMEKFRRNASDCLRNAYMAERPIQHSTSGSVFTSLAEDTSMIVSAQLDVLHDYLVSSHLLCSDAGDALLADAAGAVLRNLWHKQIEFRDAFLDGDVERCCASSNDFYRMMDLPEQVLATFRERYPHMSEDDGDGTGFGGGVGGGASKPALPVRELSDLTALYGSDAIYAAQSVHRYAVEAFHDATECEGEDGTNGDGDGDGSSPAKAEASVSAANPEPALFSREWEVDLTNNEVATSLARTMEDCLSDAEIYLGNPLLYKKAVDAMIAAAVTYYVRMLLRKAKEVRKARKAWGSSKSAMLTLTSTSASIKLNRGGGEEEPSAFLHAGRALFRIEGDIRSLRSVFEHIAGSSPPLRLTVERKFAALTAVHECMCIAAASAGAGDCDGAPDGLTEFAIVLHKLSGCRFDFARLWICDLWHLVSPGSRQRVVKAALDEMRDDLNKLNVNVAAVGDPMLSQEDMSECARIPDLRLDLVFAEMYGDDDRRMEVKEGGSRGGGEGGGRKTVYQFGIKSPAAANKALLSAKQMAGKLKHDLAPSRKTAQGQSSCPPPPPTPSTTTSYPLEGGGSAAVISTDLRSAANDGGDAPVKNLKTYQAVQPARIAEVRDASPAKEEEVQKEAKGTGESKVEIKNVSRVEHIRVSKIQRSSEFRDEHSDESTVKKSNVSRFVHNDDGTMIGKGNKSVKQEKRHRMAEF